MPNNSTQTKSTSSSSNTLPYSNEPQIAAATSVNSLSGRTWADFTSLFETTTYQNITGIAVKLYTSSGQLLKTTVTDSNGYYNFTDLKTGDYKLQFEVINNYGLYIPMQAGSSTDSDIDSNGFTSMIKYRAGDSLSNIDAGFFATDVLNPIATVGSKVWHDADIDGLQDLDEAGIAGIKVSALDSLGNVVQETFTNSQGEYLFSLAAGQYQFKFAQPEKSIFTYANQGNSDLVDSDVNNLGLTGLIDVKMGQIKLDVDAGIAYRNALPNNKNMAGTATLSSMLSDNSNMDTLLGSNTKQPTTTTETITYAPSSSQQLSTLLDSYASLTTA